MIGLANFFLLLFSLAISLLIIIPFSGVLVRFRANFNPKALRLDAEGEAQAHTGPVIESYFQMFARVYRIEGITGLYKGIMPSFVSSFVFAVIILAFLDVPKHRHSAYRAPHTNILGTLLFSILTMIMSLPTTIITYRAITTPHKLPWINPMLGLRVILTPTERRKPWLLWLTPGLMASEVAHIAVVVLILGPLRRFLIPEASGDFDVMAPAPNPVKLTIYIVAVIVLTPILTPLEVMATRLAIQRNHASAEYNSVSQEVEGDAEDVPDYAGEEDVIGLRSEEDPYLGAVDCFKRIADEEGWRALFRGWWITLLGGLGSAFG